MAGRKSKIDRLPKPVREKVGELVDAGRTIDEILEALRALDIDDISRSSVGRHVKKLNVVAERVRRSREVADALVRRIGDVGESKALRLDVELMHSAMLDLLMGGEDGEAVTLDPEAAMFMARSLRDLAAAATAAAEAGLSAETVNTIKSRILGIRPEQPA